MHKKGDSDNPFANLMQKYSEAVFDGGFKGIPLIVFPFIKKALQSKKDCKAFVHNHPKNQG